MSAFQQGLKEAALIVAASCILGFSYTATTEKGFFAKPTEQAAQTQASGDYAPEMIQLAEATNLYKAGETLFIDARHEFDYKLGHIKGAMNIPLKEFDARLDTLNILPKNKSIVVYCDGAECNSSIEFSVKLFAAGFTDVKIFFGGWREWTDNQLPTEKNAP